VIVVVADASPLIALQQIDQLALLKALFDEVVIPPAVAREVAPRLMLPSWIRERALLQPIERSPARLPRTGRERSHQPRPGDPR